MVLNFIYWDISPEIINLGGVSVRYYSILFVAGLILSITTLEWMFKREMIPSENINKLTLFGILGIVFGARIGHCLLYEADYYLAHPLEMLLPISFGPDGSIQFTGYRGLASHGGVFGLLTGIFIYSKLTKHSMLDTVDLITVIAGISFGFIRLGNFMNSEILGTPTSVPWAVVFAQIDNVPRHPAQLYEAIAYLVIFAILMWLYIKKRPRNGFLFGLGTVLFFVARFVIEFVKADQVGFEDAMTFNMGQLLSLPYIIVGLGFIFYSIRKKRKLEAQHS